MQQTELERLLPGGLVEHYATLRDLENLTRTLPTKDDWWALKKMIQEEQARHRAEAEARERYGKYIAALMAISAALFSAVIALLIALLAG